MGDNSTIEWTDATWNPVVGCTHCSPGCDNCYAARQVSTRLKNVPVYAGLAADGKFTGEVRCLPERLDQPSHWRKPRRIFVNSMSDLFHPDVPGEFIVKVYAEMVASDWHTFQTLTKRPQRMAALFNSDEFQRAVQERIWELETHMFAGFTRPSHWWGTSIESDRYTFRADHLRETPAAVRFLSLEPLLGPLPSLNLEGIDWVIVGGESGPGARPMHIGWVREIRDRCAEAGVPFFFKQWGEWAPAGAYRGPDHHLTIDGRLFEPGQRLGPSHMMRPIAIHKWGKKKAGRELDGRTWDEMPVVAR